MLIPSSQARRGGSEQCYSPKEARKEAQNSVVIHKEARKEAQNSVIPLSGRLRMRLRTVLLLFF